jgi:ABC-type branched-subunit amino acid transport system substrate-binding protein
MPRIGMSRRVPGMVRVLNAEWRRSRRAVLAGLAATTLAFVAGCAGTTDMFSSQQPQQPAQQPTTVGSGQVRVGLILPLSGQGNAAAVAVSMKNAAEMALAEFNSPNVQLLIKDDNGTASGAQTAAAQALEEGAEIIVGPLFAHSVGVVGQAARARGVPVIAFSTDANVASRGIYLLSFLPESDVDRIIDYAAANGKRSFAAMLPDNAYGNVVEAAFKQAAARKGARIVALEKYGLDSSAIATTARTVAAAAARGADSVFIPDGAEAVPSVVQQLYANGLPKGRVQLMGTGLWDDSRMFGDPNLQGGWFAAPDPQGFRNFSQRYKQRFGSDPVRTATLSYDAVALIAALVKTQGAQRFSETILTNPSGFAGIDGLFRFRQDGTNERGLAVHRISGNGSTIIAPPPRAFSGSGY